MRGFIEDQGAGFFFQRLKACATPNSLGRQETFKDETVGRQARRRQCSDQRARSRNRHYIDTSGSRLAYQVVAGIGDQRRARVGDQRYIVAGQQAHDEATAFLALVVLMASR